jgi:hypothetical protein
VQIGGIGSQNIGAAGAELCGHGVKGLVLLPCGGAGDNLLGGTGLSAKCEEIVQGCIMRHG